MKKLFAIFLVVMIVSIDAGTVQAQALNEPFITENSISERSIVFAAYMFSTYPPAKYQGQPLIRAEKKTNYYIGYYMK